jgi:hypothetical protein
LSLLVTFALVTRYSRQPQALHATVGEDLVVLNPESLAYYEFNDVGARIWELLGAGALDEDQLVAALLAEYEIDESRCHQSVGAFLADAEAKGLVTVE